MPKATLNSGRLRTGANTKLAIAPASNPIKLLLTNGCISLSAHGSGRAVVRHRSVIPLCYSVAIESAVDRGKPIWLRGAPTRIFETISIGGTPNRGTTRDAEIRSPTNKVPSCLGPSLHRCDGPRHKVRAIQDPDIVVSLTFG
jgi:hypothetical protein